MGGQINPLYFLSVFELHKPLMQQPVSGLACSKEEVVQNDLVKTFPVSSGGCQLSKC